MNIPSTVNLIGAVLFHTFPHLMINKMLLNHNKNIITPELLLILIITLDKLKGLYRTIIVFPLGEENGLSELLA